MIERQMKNVLLDRLQKYPAVSLLGPRQAGKTTLTKSVSSVYYDLEAESDKLKLDIEWNVILHQQLPVVLGEAQNDPEIFPKIRGAIDMDRKRNGRFLILGSISPALLKNVSESLAGRIAMIELAPFSAYELDRKKHDSLWLMGGYPDGGILDRAAFFIWQENYLNLMAMRDLPAWGLRTRPKIMDRFFHMLAVSHGNVWNASQLGRSLGISFHTVNVYLDWLEHAFLVRRIPPYHANIRKRLYKSPKIYWRDSGLLHALLKTDSIEMLLKQPWVGASWEGWVIEQILIQMAAWDIPFDGPYYFRTSDGYELDLIFGLHGDLWAIEIKLTSAPGREDMNRLNQCADMIGAKKRILISRSIQSLKGEDTLSSNLMGFLDYLKMHSSSKSH